MFLLLPLATWIVLWLILDRYIGCWRSSILAASLIWGVALSLITEILSTFKGLNFSGLVITWSMVTIAVVYSYARIRQIPHPLVGGVFDANINYWQLTPTREDYLFQHNPDVMPDDCSVVILGNHWLAAGQGLPKDLFHSGRQYITVYLDNTDGILTPAWTEEFRKFDFIFRSHYNHRLSYPSNILPWAFGLSNRILQELNHPLEFSARRRALLVNFRNVVDHPLRQTVSDYFFPYIDKILPLDTTVDTFDGQASTYHVMQWQQTGRRHYPSYYQRLQTTTAAACFGGYLQIHRTSGSMIVPWWDSWRFWEAMAAGCVAFHVDFEQYGVTLPEMPQNWQHYIGIDLDDIEATGDRLMEEPDLLLRISEAGRTWAIEHYSPIPTAQRFLQTLQAGRADAISAPSFATGLASDQPDSQSVAVTLMDEPVQAIERKKAYPTIVIDAIFFQLYKSGIGRVWFALLQEWATTSFAPHLVVLDRAGTAPNFPGLTYHDLPRYDYNTVEDDRQMVQGDFQE